MKRVVNFRTANTKWCYERVVEKIERILNSNFVKGVIFLDLPKYFTPYVLEQKYLYLLDNANIYNLQNLRAVQPLLDFANKQNFKIYCYKDDAHAYIDENTSFQLLTLVLKAKLSKINLDEWIETISSSLNSEKEFGEYEANYIAERSGRINFCMNLSESTMSHLKEMGFHLEHEKMYSFNRPIDLIYRTVNEMLSKRIEKDSRFETKMIELIREHIKFIDLVSELGYESACKLYNQQ